LKVKDDTKRIEDRKHEKNTSKNKGKTTGSLARQMDAFL
jgi:hypothetical protein